MRNSAFAAVAVILFCEFIVGVAFVYALAAGLQWVVDHVPLS